jgi:hypothetical protein
VATLYSVERALQRSIATWIRLQLTAALPTLQVHDHWPDASTRLVHPTISVLRVSGARRDTLVDPQNVGHVNVHDEMPARIDVPVVTDTSSAIVALNEFKARWNAHCASTASHRSADATNVVAAADAFDQATAIPLAIACKAAFLAHAPSDVFHDAGDLRSTVTAPTPFDESSLVAIAQQLRIGGNSHFVARHFLWRIRACELPLQLDCWAASEAGRDDLMARLDAVLNADATPGLLDGGAPARNGLLLELASGHEGVVADVVFDNPDLEDASEEAKRQEWRATYRGLADFNLTVRAQSARLARLKFSNTVYESTIVGAPIEVATLTHVPGSEPAEDLTA